MNLHSQKFDFSNYFRNRAVIYCYSSAERIAQQIIKRKDETGFILPQHKNLSFKELVKAQEESLIEVEKVIKIYESYNVPILKVNTADSSINNINLISDFIKNISQPLQYLTYSEFFEYVTKMEGGHWTANTITRRWDYHSRVVNLVKALDIQNPSSILEMGTMGVQCVKNSHTIDYAERWDFPDKLPNYLHDARQIPWPIEDKRYELFIALRVFQHLTPLQRECAIESMRIARKVIIVVPSEYNNKVIPQSRGITYSDFVNFLDGVHPNIFFTN